MYYIIQLKVNLVPVSICMVVNIPWQIMERFGEIRVIVRSGLGLWLALGLRLHGTKVAVVTLYRLHSWQTVHGLCCILQMVPLIKFR